MKKITILLSLFLFCLISVQAQSGQKRYNITKEKFRVKIKVEKNNSFKVLSFISSKGKRHKSKLLKSKSLNQLKLRPGSIVEGSFQFETFATEGGLGTTRVISGEGSGELVFTKVLNAKNQNVGCPPLCEKSVKLKFQLN